MVYRSSSFIVGATSALLSATVILVAVADDQEPLDRLRIEEFLRTAEVIDREPLEIGVTRSHRLTLSDGTRTMQAVWKTIDESRPVKRFDRGLPELGFTDTYKNEIAAYELDKLLQLDMVPPTVERRMDRQHGSLQLWIEGCITEAERFKRKLQPPDTDAWSEQVFKIRLFRQLIHDTDWENASNILCDGDFKIWSVDHSRAFRLQTVLLNGDYLRRFSRSLLERLRLLDSAILEERLGPWVTKPKRKAILARRDLILARASEVIAERGEDAVLYP